MGIYVQTKSRVKLTIFASNIAFTYSKVQISAAATCRQIAAKQVKLTQIRRTFKYDTSAFRVPRQYLEKS